MSRKERPRSTRHGERRIHRPFQQRERDNTMDSIAKWRKGRIKNPNFKMR